MTTTVIGRPSNIERALRDAEKRKDAAELDIATLLQARKLMQGLAGQVTVPVDVVEEKTIRVKCVKGAKMPRGFVESHIVEVLGRNTTLSLDEIVAGVKARGVESPGVSRLKTVVGQTLSRSKKFVNPSRGYWRRRKQFKRRDRSEDKHGNVLSDLSSPTSPSDGPVTVVDSNGDILSKGDVRRLRKDLKKGQQKELDIS